MASRSGVVFARIDERRQALRLQADERLVECLRASAHASEGGMLVVPTREAVARGDLVRVEISFGAMSDEIIVHGQIESVRPRDSRTTLVAIRIEWAHAARVRYVLEVLTEGRAATARKSRRIPSQISASWEGRLGTQESTLKDISKGGAFVRTATPPAEGSQIHLQLDDSMVGADSIPLELEALVAWTGRSQGTRGFGVKFRVPNRSLAGRIAALVRWQERQVGLVD